MNQLETETAPVSKLVGGIISDAQDLFKQQLAMFQAEIKEELQKGKQAAISLAAAAVVGLIGLLLAGITIAIFLQWLWPDLALWAAFGIATVLFLVIGGGIFFAGKKKLAETHPLPTRSIDALKENVTLKT